MYAYFGARDELITVAGAHRQTLRDAHVTFFGVTAATPITRSTLVLTSFTDFQRCAARVDGALGRQRSSQISEHHAGAEGLRDES